MNVENTTQPVDQWVVGGVLLSSIVTIKETNIGIRRTENAERSYAVYIESNTMGPPRNQHQVQNQVDDQDGEHLQQDGDQPRESNTMQQHLPAPVDREPMNPGPVQFSGPLAAPHYL